MPRQLDLEYPEAAYHAMNRPTAGPTRPGERGILRRFGVGVIAKRDAENRLVAVQSCAVPTRAKRRLEFEYDTMGRRVSKKTYTHTGSADVPQSQAEYVWDGWNLVAEFDGADALIRAYSWGTDLSGSIQGAGGVGGLIAVSVGGTMYFPAYDGNGNVVAYVSGGSGQVSAQHEYGPFGEVIRPPVRLARPSRFGGPRNTPTWRRTWFITATVITTPPPDVGSPEILSGRMAGSTWMGSSATIRFPRGILLGCSSHLAILCLPTGKFRRLLRLRSTVRAILGLEARPARAVVGLGVMLLMAIQEKRRRCAKASKSFIPELRCRDRQRVLPSA